MDDFSNNCIKYAGQFLHFSRLSTFRPFSRFFFKTRHQVIVVGKFQKFSVKTSLVGFFPFNRDTILKPLFPLFFFQAQKLLEAEKYFGVVPIPRPSSKIVTADAQIEQVYYSLVSFFFVLKSVFPTSVSGHEFKWFPAIKKASNWQTRQVSKLKACFFGLISCPDSDLRKN